MAYGSKRRDAALDFAEAEGQPGGSCGSQLPVGEIASRKPGWLAATAALGAAFSLWAIAGAGLEPVLWGAVLILGALPVYWLMRRSALPRPEPAQP